MTPEEATAVLAEVVAPRSEFSEEEIYAAMAKAGVPDEVADRAYKFTQIAWARAYLRPLGIKLSSDYICFDGAGEIIESGELADQPYFAAATALAERHASSPGFARFALMSADVNAINQALNAGSKPESLALTTAGVFFGDVTDEGLEKAKRALFARKRSSAPKRSAKPWWRFW